MATAGYRSLSQTFLGGASAPTMETKAGYRSWCAAFLLGGASAPRRIIPPPPPEERSRGAGTRKRRTRSEEEAEFAAEAASLVERDDLEILEMLTIITPLL